MKELLSIIFGLVLLNGLNAFSGVPGPDEFLPAMDEVVLDTIPVKERYGDFVTDPKKNPFDITPSIVEQKVEYDPVTGNYIVFEKIGDEYYRTPTYLTLMNTWIGDPSKRRKNISIDSQESIQAGKGQV